MTLAVDPIFLTISGEAYQLRPTLRAALRLTRRYGDFSTVYKAVATDHLTIVTDVIREGTGSNDAATDYGYQIDSGSIGLRRHLAPIKPALLDYIVQLAGADNDDDSAPGSAGDPMPFADYFSRLFEIATGWLGWTPAEAWAATPAEILAAQHGRADLVTNILKSVFGSSDHQDEFEATPIPDQLNDDGTDPSFDRAGFEALKARFGKVPK